LIDCTATARHSWHTSDVNGFCFINSAQIDALH